MNIFFPATTGIQTVKSTKISFKKTKTGCCGDIFEKSDIITVKNYKHELKGKKVKDITLKTKKGKTEDGFILQDASNPNQYFVCVNGKTHCRTVFYDKGDSIYVSELYGDANEGNYKGAGTELLKFAAEESIKRGHKGKLTLKAGGSLPFYYKCNFRSKDEKDIKQNAFFDYLSRATNKKTGSLFHIISQPDLVLDEKSAKALLEGKRLSEETKSCILFELQENKDFPTSKTDVHFYDGGDEYLIQVIDGDSWSDGRIAYMTGKIKDRKLIKGETIEYGKEEPSDKICELTEKGRLEAEKLYNNKE